MARGRIERGTTVCLLALCCPARPRRFQGHRVEQDVSHSNVAARSCADSRAIAAGANASAPARGRGGVPPPPGRRVASGQTGYAFASKTNSKVASRGLLRTGCAQSVAHAADAMDRLVSFPDRPRGIEGSARGRCHVRLFRYPIQLCALRPARHGGLYVVRTPAITGALILRDGLK